MDTVYFWNVWHKDQIKVFVNIIRIEDDAPWQIYFLAISLNYYEI